MDKIISQVFFKLSLDLKNTDVILKILSFINFSCPICDFLLLLKIYNTTSYIPLNIWYQQLIWSKYKSFIYKALSNSYPYPIICESCYSDDRKFHLVNKFEEIEAYVNAEQDDEIPETDSEQYYREEEERYDVDEDF